MKQKDGPNNNKGMTYWTDGKYLSKTIGYLVGEVQLACYSLNNHALLGIISVE